MNYTVKNKFTSNSKMYFVEKYCIQQKETIPRNLEQLSCKFNTNIILAYYPVPIQVIYILLHKRHFSSS